ncbi:DUF952 domain-containing protein [Streptomyces sp. NPDC048304]|uniref:DUF952 domain-containing protein n=1 Tax=Streptomyces sp. NPDC048304 TaxID=3154820 RepID=UPI0033DE173B
MPKLPRIFHITERSLWEAARERGAYEVSTRGRTLQQEGFVHFSTREQLPRIAESLYGGYDGLDELVVLVVDPALVGAPVKYEAAEPGGEEFPHVYGPVPADAVVEVEPWG